MFGFTFFDITKYAKDRAIKIGEFLMFHQPDIIFLQELSNEYLKELEVKLSSVYPYIITTPFSGKFLDNGLIFFSKIPVEQNNYIHYKASSFLENTMMTKGIQWAKINKDGIKINLINTHLIATDIGKGPTNIKIEQKRNEQIEQLHNYVNSLPQEEITIIAGDFNNGPQVSFTNYKKLINNYTDLFSMNELLKGKAEEQFTWLPENKFDNRLVKIIFRHSPAERIDHFFISNHQNKLISNMDIKIFNNNSDHLLSDHMPVFLQFDLK